MLETQQAFQEVLQFAVELEGRGYTPTVICDALFAVGAEVGKQVADPQFTGQFLRRLADFVDCGQH
jgi:hypothetical protein